MRALVTFCVVLQILSLGWAQQVNSVTREYEVRSSPDSVRSALKQMGVYNGAQLPTLEGFVKSDSESLNSFERPYYEYRVEIVPGREGKTVVRVRAVITGWWNAPDSKQSAYKVLESNGRLEADLDARLEGMLKSASGTGASVEAAEPPQAPVASKDKGEGATKSFAGANKSLKQVPYREVREELPEFAVVSRSNVPIFDRAQAASFVVAKAAAEDEFPVVRQRGEWIEVRVEANRTGWLRRSDIQSIARASTYLPEGAGHPDGSLPFVVSREMTMEFHGEWPKLKGKQTLYVWLARPGVGPRPEPSAKLRMVESLFSDRYLQALHSNGNGYQGLVVIFPGGGVAAASMDDIAAWKEQRLGTNAFLGRCSLDPVGEFRSSSEKAETTTSQSSANR